MQLLDEIPICWQTEWPLFSRAEIIDTIIKYSSLSTPDLDYISWNHLEIIANNSKCTTNIINIANACINLSYWPLHFKKPMFIIITKPNKSAYNNSKVFQPIVFLNTLGKLIEKVISNRFLNISRMDKKSSHKYSCIWHCSILPFLELLTLSDDSKQSRLWLQYFPIFL